MKDNYPFVECPYCGKWDEIYLEELRYGFGVDGIYGDHEKECKSCGEEYEFETTILHKVRKKE
jgi:hypothetical protein